MIVEDKRLDRMVMEEIGVTSTYVEHELDNYDFSLDDHDHRLLLSQVDYVVDVLEDNDLSRRGIAKAMDQNTCFIGIQVLIRDRIHVLGWLRSSDIDEYRDRDIGFMTEFGRRVRERLDLEDKELMVHLFTSSLHKEVDDGE